MTSRPLFTIVPPSSRNATVKTAFSLHKDKWDDFGFKTQYQLFFHDKGKTTYIGSLKILQKGQGKTSVGVLEHGPLGRLSPEFCSVGQSLDYYERLAEIPEDIRAKVLPALRDVIFRPKLKSNFKKEVGWSTSLTREIPDIDNFYKTALGLLSKNYAGLADQSIKLRFRPRGWRKFFTFDYNANDYLNSPNDNYFSEHKLPNRIAVIVGKNGSGKSTLLARLARVAHASEKARTRDPIRKLGSLRPEGIGFTRIITISYSAFDSFEIPGVTVEERRQIASDVSEGTGRYIFCGLRDIAAELKSQLGNESDIDLEKIVDANDLAQTTLLKPVDQLANEFERTLSRIKESGRWALFERALQPLVTDSSFNGLGDVPLNRFFGKNIASTFLRWSTGHKIVMQIISALIAYTQPKSMILLDEPETHLHPPLLAALMHSIRFILAELDAFAIVATHSPVVAQETLSRDVSILRRNGADATIKAPKIETFGESIGEITDEIFGLNSNITDYHEILKRLTSDLKTFKKIDQQFEYGLSLQARAYVLSLLAMEED